MDKRPHIVGQFIDPCWNLTSTVRVADFPLSSQPPSPTPEPIAMQRHSFQALNSTFVVDSEYQFVKELGQGAYGCVVAAKHRRSGEGCAIKKITAINTKVCPISCLLSFEADSILFSVFLPSDVYARSSTSHLIGAIIILTLSQIASPLPWSQKCQTHSVLEYNFFWTIITDYLSVWYGHRLPSGRQLRWSLPLCTSSMPITHNLLHWQLCVGRAHGGWPSCHC